MTESQGTDRMSPFYTATRGNDQPPPGFSITKERYRKNRNFDMTASWRDWLWKRYAKMWYGVGSFILDGMVVGVVFQYMDASQVWPYLLSVAVVVGLLYLEYRGLKHFWPPKSPPRSA